MNNGAGDRLDRVERILQQLAERDEEFDKRIQQLAAQDARIEERHEALAQTVEIVAGMQRANERAIAEIKGGIGEITGLLKEAAHQINALARIAASHEHRIEDLESE
jgi:hypothetical protein